MHLCSDFILEIKSNTILQLKRLCVSSNTVAIPSGTVYSELEALWESFLVKKRIEDVQDEDARQQWDTFSARKLIFIPEVRFLTHL